MSKSPCRILIADDHEAIRLGVRNLLDMREDWQIVGEAADGFEALRLARETMPDIAILDYSLPYMNGLELTHAIKRELPRTKILIYTMHDQESILAEVLRAGARGCVLKSDGPLHLISAVEALATHMPYLSTSVPEALIGHFTDWVPRDQ